MYVYIHIYTIWYTLIKMDSSKSWRIGDELAFFPKRVLLFNIGLGNYIPTHAYIYIYVHPSTLKNRLQKRNFVEESIFPMK